MSPLPSSSGPFPYIDKAIGALAQLNVGAAAVFVTVGIIRDLWRAAHPSAPEVTDAALIDRMEATFVALGQSADAEIARLREKLAADDAAVSTRVDSERVVSTRVDSER